MSEGAAKKAKARKDPLYNDSADAAAARGPPPDQIPRSHHRCQFCGERSPARAWGPVDECPRCGKRYDAILAQDDETD